MPTIEKAPFSGKLPLKLAIVGGGRACKFFLKLIGLGNLPYLQIQIIGVCDINPRAEGFRMAQRMGIYTTTDFRDLFSLDGLDGIIELTSNRDVLVELIQLRPARIGIIEHNIGRLLRNLFKVDQRLRSAEQQIVFEKALRDFLIQQNQQCIVVINTDFTIDSVNDAYLQTVNKSREAVIGAPCYQVIHNLAAPCDALQNGVVCPMLETLRTGQSTQGIHSLTAGESTTALYDIVTYPVRNAKGDIVRVIEIWMDIEREIASRWKKREQELRSDLNKLIQEDRMISLGKLVASCVHEINNPIQGLLTFSHIIKEMLSADTLTQAEIGKLRGFTDLMADELDRCGKIISSLLSFSRTSKDTFRTIHLNEVISTVIDLVRHRMELQDIVFKMDLTDAPLFVHGDINRLQQCFLNLIFNAIEAMGPGGRLGIVSRRIDDQRLAEVAIEDSGHGIARKHLNHIFDPFFTTKPMGQGTGMGLSIVYGVVKNHRGEIRVESVVDQGTTFTIQLPLVRAVSEQDGKPG
ncbi:Two component system sensor histidine kinase [Desulfosarcina cetonica]|nr:Two component system sensor histidine kinase [Desulfosarcina cetonica]